MKMEITSTEFKVKLTQELKDAGAGLTRNQKLKIAIDLDIAPATFDRYTSGEIQHVRRLELAESILEEIKKIQSTFP